MTREQAKELKFMRSKQSESISFDRLDFMLDEIYDDFGLRTCENCSLIDDCWVKLNADNEGIIFFNCNKWESK